MSQTRAREGEVEVVREVTFVDSNLCLSEKTEVGIVIAFLLVTKSLLSCVII